MARNLSASEQRLSRIFSDEYLFSIPGYQRPYAWEVDQARELLDDVIDYMAVAPVMDEQVSPYFLGSIVLIKQEADPRADVVDGQQRLTTLTLLLSCIRSLIDEAHGNDIGVFIGQRGNKISGTEDRFRLTLREKDAEFFRKYVQNSDGMAQLVNLDVELPDGQRNLRDNARYLRSRLGLLEPTVLIRLGQFLVKHCCLVVVATTNTDSAYRIFSVLNSRGLDLAATDILKARVLGDIPKGKQDAYTKKWEDAESDLGRDQFEALFGHIRMIYRRAKPQGTLVKEFEEHVEPRKNPIEFIDGLLVPMAYAYQQILDQTFGTSPAADQVNTRLRWLDRLLFSDWVPPALAYLNRHRAVAPEVDRFLADLERLAYGLMILQVGINERIERFSKLTAAIQSGADLFAEESVLQLSPEEQDRIYNALNGPFYVNFPARIRSIILLRLDTLLSAGGATYEFDKVTVEHVLPQTPETGSDWLKWVTQEDAYEWVHQIGNLALLTRSKNSSAKNYEFTKKKVAYFTRNGVSPFAITTQVLRVSEWTVDVMRARQNELMSLMESHWRLEKRRGILSVFEEPAGS